MPIMQNEALASRRALLVEAGGGWNHWHSNCSHNTGCSANNAVVSGESRFPARSFTFSLPCSHRMISLILQGMSSLVNFDSTLAGAISMSRVLVVEGYLWEIPQTIMSITKACELARRQGVLVALTASDVTCIRNRRHEFWSAFYQLKALYSLPVHFR